MSNIHWLDFNDAADQMPEESFEARRERLRRALIGQLPSVLHHLFPSGKIRNDAFKIGSLDGQRGDSLNVTLRKALGRPACLRARVVTSGRRWEERGVWRPIVLMWWLRWRYWRGEPAERLAQAYR